MRTYKPDSSALISELYTELAFFEMTMADNFCNGIPLGHTIEWRADQRRAVDDAAGVRQRVGTSRYRDRYGEGNGAAACTCCARHRSSRREC